MAANGAREDRQAGEHQEQEPSKPLYEIIRDQLIADIDSGAYPVGALLPSIRDMSVRWTVSTTTARRVLAELVNAGYARAEGTRGHTAIRPEAATKKQGEASQVPEGPASSAAAPLVRTAQVITRQGTVDASTTRIDVRSEPAPSDVAIALDLKDSSTPVFVRRRVTADAGGNPIQFRVSYVSPRIGPESTDLVSPDAISAPWLEVLKTSVGSAITVTESYICARHPNDTEAAMLMLAPSACVLVRVDRTQDSDGLPVDYTVTVWPGDSTRILNLDS